jgi:hypothetical protein
MAIERSEEERMEADAGAAVDFEEVESTKSEKLLAVVLAVFLLIGGIWAYAEIDDYVDAAIAQPRQTPAERAALERLRVAEERLAEARIAEEGARADLELRREAYRTALDAERPAAQLELRYRAATAAHESAQAEVRAAEAAVETATPAAALANERFTEEVDEREETRVLVAFLLRLAFVAASIGFAYGLLARMRRRGSRFLPLGLAVVGYATVLAIVLAADYITDYVDPLELGPLVLSLFGIAATIAAFVALQRHLEKRLPHRRARRRQCPYCGFPAGDGEHCEGCGRAVVARCESCGEARRVGAPHCASCGAAA